MEDNEEYRTRVRHAALDFALRYFGQGNAQHVRQSELLQTAVQIENYLITGATRNEQRHIDF